MKVSELKGAALDWAVCMCEGCDHQESLEGSSVARYQWSSDPTQGEAIIEREQIKVVEGNPLYFPKGNEHGEHYESLWIATINEGGRFHGQTRLMAAMRCYVASKLGEEVEIPEELI